MVLVGIEALRRAEALSRAHTAQQAAVQLQHQATLGRYMLEMRHNLNNALTSVLGNSELLLLEPGALPAAARDQIDTIRHMALRMHEIIHRFSSLEAEMRFAEKHPEHEIARAAKASAARAAD
jgi:signal transduction histidine kinase